MSSLKAILPVFVAGFLSTAVMADDSLYVNVESGTATNVNNITAQSASNSKMSYNNIAQSFYLDLKTRVGMPNFKLEYTSNAYSTNYGEINSNYINNQANFLDVNLQYGDVVSYYTLRADNYDVGVNLGGGLRQYVGEIDSSQMGKESFYSTIPLTYLDMFYSLDKNEYVGLYSKGSQLATEKIQESGLYYKNNITNVDNLSFIATYALSNLSLADDYKANNDAGIQTNGLNFQLKLSY
jgi:hypothetical protein